MNIEEIDKWLKDEEGISYTELGNEFNDAVELSNKCAKKIMQKDKEIERLNNIINELKKYIKDTKQDGYKLVWINKENSYFEAGIEEILGDDKK